MVRSRLFAGIGRVRISVPNHIFAAHFPFINVPGYYFARMYQERSYVLALENTEVCRGMYLGIEKDALSVRPQGDLLLLGGCSHRTGTDRRGGHYDRLRETGKTSADDGSGIRGNGKNDEIGRKL